MRKMDNEHSQLVKAHIKYENNLDLLLCPLHLHQTKAAQKAINIIKPILLLVSKLSIHIFPCTYGADYYIWQLQL